MAAHHVEIKTCIQILSEFIAAPRRLRLKNIVRSRSNIASVLLENVIDTGNENAVTRTMEGMGFHHLYRLRNDSKLTTNKKLNKLQRTDSGARKWLVTHTYNNMKECVEAVRRDGYQLACAVPRAPCSIFDLGMGKKTAFVFGNESGGVSRLLQEESDVKFSLPMCGFVESYNVSVAAAITLFQVYYNQLKHTKVKILSSVIIIVYLRLF